MDTALALLIGLIAGVAIASAVAWVRLRRATASIAGAESDRAAATAAASLIEARHSAEIAELRLQESTARGRLSAELAAISATAIELEKQVGAHEDRYRELIERRDADKRADVEREREESVVLQALSPVQETLRTMQRTVAGLEAQRTQQHGELAEQLRSAAESEERLRMTAESLASALRNNATRGVWGETQLRNVVESAGLTNRVDFSVQSTIAADSGTRRPDMIVNLPGGKMIAVDAKVPYNAYLEASQIPATASGSEEARRRSLLAAHAKQVRSHVDALHSKSYWSGLANSPEFTIAFIPSESLLAAALEQDAALLDYAFSKRIALASPVNLWAVLKTVAFTWQQDVLTDDAKLVFDLGKELHGRLATLAEHADKLRRSIDSTVTSYNRFAGSLESRVLRTARRLDALDESTAIPRVEAVQQQTSRFSAIEFELSALDETGIGRTEFEGTGVDGAGSSGTAETGAQEAG